jgi:hypothetical protein
MFLDVTDRVLMEREQARLAAENVYLQEEIKSVHNFEEIIGQRRPWNAFPATRGRETFVS